MNSKQKGKRAELEVVHILKDWGYDARRSAQYQGNTGDAPDIVGIDGFHFEVKHQETTKIWDWIEQAERDSAKSGDVPLVVYRKNGKPYQVSLSLENFLKILEGKK